MLAQGLVRRKLFPGSDCLKWKDREAGLSAELVAHAWDVGCFQVSAAESLAVGLNGLAMVIERLRLYLQDKSEGARVARKWEPLIRERPKSLVWTAFTSDSRSAAIELMSSGCN